MFKNFIKLNLSPWPKFDKEDIEEVSQVLCSGKVNYWTGDKGKEFEKKFADYVGTSKAIALSNGTVALSTAYLSLGLGEGDEFITTPRTFIATTSSGVLLRAKPIFADVDINSGCISAKTIEPLITKKTKVISVVHLGGWPANMEEICDLAKDKGIYVLEDCSQAHGAKIGGKSVGCFGNVATWSFCQDKIMTTGGEGGMITTSSSDIYSQIWEYKDHGKSLEAIENTKDKKGFKWLHESFGTNYRMTELQSSIGLLQLQKMKEWNNLRTKNAMIIYEAIENIPCIRVPLPNKNFKHAWYKFYAYIKPKNLLSDWSRDRIIYEITSRGFPAFSGSCSEIYLEKCFKSNKIAPKKRLYNAQLLGETSIMFLVHPTISNSEIIKYAEVIASVLKLASNK